MAGAQKKRLVTQVPIGLSIEHPSDIPASHAWTTTRATSPLDGTWLRRLKPKVFQGRGLQRWLPWQRAVPASQTQNVPRGTSRAIGVSWRSSTCTVPRLRPATLATCRSESSPREARSRFAAATIAPWVFELSSLTRRAIAPMLKALDALPSRIPIRMYPRSRVEEHWERHSLHHEYHWRGPRMT